MNDGQKEQDFATCAHLRVERFTVENDGRVFEEQWRCRDCGTKFIALDSLFAGPQKIQVMEPRKTLRDEFAMAALMAAGYQINGGCSGDAVAMAYKWADAMMEARK
jgi:hypothetical protein